MSVTLKPEKKKGEMFLYLSAALWSIFPIITILSYVNIPSLLSLAWGTTFSAVFFAVIVTLRRRWREVFDIRLYKDVVWVTLFIGGYYCFYFLGLENTSPGNASLIALFEVFTSYLFFHIIRKDPVSRSHILGGLLMICGAVIVLVPNYKGLHAGDFFILIGTCFPPIANYFQQKVRKNASSESLMLLRSGFSIPLLFLLAFVFHQSTSVGSLQAALPFLLINGFILFGLSKLFWIEAIHRIPVAKGVALASMSPFLTLFFAWLILKQPPSVWQLTALVPMVLGVLLLTDQFTGKKSSRFLKGFLTTQEGV